MNQDLQSKGTLISSVDVAYKPSVVGYDQHALSHTFMCTYTFMHVKEMVGEERSLSCALFLFLHVGAAEIMKQSHLQISY